MSIRVERRRDQVSVEAREAPNGARSEYLAVSYSSRWSVKADMVHNKLLLKLICIEKLNLAPKTE